MFKTYNFVEFSYYLPRIQEAIYKDSLLWYATGKCIYQVQILE